MRTTTAFLVFLIALRPMGAAAQEIQPAVRTVLSTQDSQFTLNGKPAFLYGISYYGALGASEETVRRDLADMKRHGFNWLRVWRPGRHSATMFQRWTSKAGRANRS